MVTSRFKLKMLLNLIEQKLAAATRIHTIYLKGLTSIGTVVTVINFLFDKFHLQSFFRSEEGILLIIECLAILLGILAILPIFVNKRYNDLSDLQNDLYIYVFSLPFDEKIK